MKKKKKKRKQIEMGRTEGFGFFIPACVLLMEVMVENSPLGRKRRESFAMQILIKL